MMNMMMQMMMSNMQNVNSHAPQEGSQPTVPAPAVAASYTPIAQTEEERELTRLRDTMPQFKNKRSKICTTYKFMGAAWTHGKRTTVPKKLKLAAIMWIHPRVWNALRLSLLGEEEVDALVFILFLVLPYINVADLQVNTKEDLFDMLLEEHRRVKHSSPHRFSALAADLSNVKAVAKELGFPMKYFEPDVARTPESGPNRHPEVELHSESDVPPALRNRSADDMFAASPGPFSKDRRATAAVAIPAPQKNETCENVVRRVRMRPNSSMSTASGSSGGAAANPALPNKRLGAVIVEPAVQKQIAQPMVDVTNGSDFDSEDGSTWVAAALAMYVHAFSNVC
jgi:hypothetical protein